MIARTLLPQRVFNALLANTALYRLRIGEPPRMSTGVGDGLSFDPGPSNRAYASGNNELPVQQALLGCLKPGGVFYDIGANVGFFTVIGARITGAAGLVHAFEPVPENAAYVRLNARLNGFRNVVVSRKAVSSAPGQSAFWTAKYSGGGALTSATPPPDAKELINVEVVSVDDLVFRQKWARPTVVKIDVEGAEADVLHGMSRTLREVRPFVIYEIDDGEPAAFDAKFTACEDILRAAGYTVERLENSYPGAAWLVGHGLASPR